MNTWYLIERECPLKLNDKIVDLKEKVESVSSGLSESNKVLAEIGSSSSGPVGWALEELTKGFSKSKNSITSAVQSLQSDVPDLPEIYFNLIKESMTDPNTLQELLKQQETQEKKRMEKMGFLERQKYKYKKHKQKKAECAEEAKSAESEFIAKKIYKACMD